MQMLVGNKIPYNDAFWQYLNNQLLIIFNEKMECEYHYNCIYQSQGTISDLLKKRKTNQAITVHTIIVFALYDDEKEYLGKLTLGKYSIKAYANIKGVDLTKCLPKSDFNEWVKVDEQNKIIEIYLN